MTRPIRRTVLLVKESRWGERIRGVLRGSAIVVGLGVGEGGIGLVWFVVGEEVAGVAEGGVPTRKRREDVRSSRARLEILCNLK